MVHIRPAGRILTCSILALIWCQTWLWAKPKPDHYRFVLPSGYIGWVQVVFGVPPRPRPTHH